MGGFNILAQYLMQTVNEEIQLWPLPSLLQEI